MEQPGELCNSAVTGRLAGRLSLPGAMFEGLLRGFVFSDRHSTSGTEGSSTPRGGAEDCRFAAFSY
jgi:hypothetical protein